MGRLSKKQATCHPDRKMLARGICRPCYHREWRLACVRIMGSRCQLCGHDDARVLDIDHIDGRLDDTGKRVKKQEHLARIRSGDTSGLQLLCANCHALRTRGHL